MSFLSTEQVILASAVILLLDILAPRYCFTKHIYHLPVLLSSLSHLHFSTAPALSLWRPHGRFRGRWLGLKTDIVTRHIRGLAVRDGNNIQGDGGYAVFRKFQKHDQVGKVHDLGREHDTLIKGLLRCRLRGSLGAGRESEGYGAGVYYCRVGPARHDPDVPAPRCSWLPITTPTTSGS